MSPVGFLGGDDNLINHERGRVTNRRIRNRRDKTRKK
jgi:hypothetical protein